MALKVLLADDSVPAQNMGKKILTDAGYDVVTVGNGLEALRKIAGVAPDIVILDIFMPGYTGLEVCKLLRANPATAALPVILTVGKLEPYRPEDGEQVQSNAVIVKPFAIGELTSAVRSLVGTWQAKVDAFGPEPDADSPEYPVPMVEEPLAEVTDEPLFSREEPLGAGNTAQLADRLEAIRMDAMAPAQSAEEALGLDNLVFDPDAGRSSFSASAFEVLSSDSQLAAESGAQSFTDFDLASDVSPDSSDAAPAGSALESWQPEPEAVLESTALEIDAAADAGLVAPEPLAAAPQSAMAEPDAIAATEAVEFEEAPGAAVAVQEPESSPLDPPAVEPFAEAWESAPPFAMAASAAACIEVPESMTPDGMIAESVTADSMIPENVIPEDAAGMDGSALAESIPQPAQDEEARRLAFEELFNSDVPFFLDGDSAAFPEPEPAMAAAPSLGELPERAAFGSEAQTDGSEAQAESGLEEQPEPWSTPAASLEPAEAVEPASGEETIFSSELPDGPAPESWSSTGEMRQPAAELGSAEGEGSAQLPDLEGEAEPHYYSDPTAEAPEILQEAASAAKEQAAGETAPERSELIAEVAKVEALLVQMQMMRQANVEMDHASIMTEYAPVEAAPSALRPVMVETAAVEAMPVLLPEYAPEETALGPVPIEAEEVEAKSAPAQVEPEAEAVLASPEIAPEELAQPEAKPPERPEAQTQPEAWMQESSAVTARAPAESLDEVERIHQAVERVFDRFRPLLVAAIVRELARQD